MIITGDAHTCAWTHTYTLNQLLLYILDKNFYHTRNRRQFP